MPRFKVVTNYGKLRDPELEAFGDGVVENLTDNENFPFVNNELTNLVEKLKAFKAALAKVSTGGKIEVTEKDNARDELIDALSFAAASVNIFARNNEAKLESSGFRLGALGSIVKIKTPAWIKVLLPKPSYTTNGIIIAIIEDSVANEDPSSWTLVTTSKHTNVLKGLKSRVLYRVCASYISTRGEEHIWSEYIIIAPI